MAEYEMILTIGGNTIRFPVLPDVFNVKSPGKNEVVTVLELGDINIIRDKGLTEIAWKSFFPAHNGPYVSVGSVNSPMSYVNALQNARDQKRHGRFVLVGEGLKISHEVAVESVDYDEKGGEVGDIYYSIKLKQWKNYGATTISTTSAKKTKVVRSGTPAEAEEKTHTVVKGDCLWALAQKYYGDGSRWPELYEKNKALIDAGNKGTGNPSATIYPGQKFIL